MSKVKNLNNKFKVMEICINEQDGEEVLEILFNKKIAFENEEVQEEVLEASKNFINDLKGILLD